MKKRNKEKMKTPKEIGGAHTTFGEKKLDMNFDIFAAYGLGALFCNRVESMYLNDQ